MAVGCCPLPMEMIFAIIDQLHDDKPTLKACSMVCKAWTHQARLHLFSKFTLNGPLQPAVFTYVCHLHIPMDWRRRTSLTAWDEVIPLLVGFDRIVSLTVDLCWRPLDTIDADSWSTLGKNFSAVVSLSLRHFSYTHLAFLARIICGFPCLRELSIRDAMHSDDPDFSSAAAFLPSPHLHTLELDVEHSAAMLEWLLSLQSDPRFVPFACSSLMQVLPCSRNSWELSEMTWSHCLYALISQTRMTQLSSPLSLNYAQSDS